MTAFTAADTLHRLVKRALDSGAAASIAAAEAMFRGYRLGFCIDEAVARDPHGQTALLTAIALARRVFLGGVMVSDLPDTPLLTPLPFGRPLTEAVLALGGRAEPVPERVPLISIGGCACAPRSPFHIRALFAGWRGGIVPAHAGVSPAPARIMPLAPMLSAALAVSEAFLFVSGEMATAGRRSAGLSLWNPAAECDWPVAPGDEPDLRLLPSRLWLLGLGHLGQAYLWGLGLLPYARPAELSLVLQDVDIVTPSTESTSVLSGAASLGRKKTRAMAEWAERRGFATAIHERLFDGSKRHSDEPAVALCGLDNSLGRRALDQAGFDFIVEAGLGRGHRDFRALRLHTLPGSRPAGQIWRRETEEEQVQDRPAYAQMLKHGDLDRCGVALLAGKAVGAPFVGAAAACLVLAEVLRLLHGGAVHEMIDLDLKCPEYRTALVTKQDFSTLNPGYVVAGP